MRVLQIIFLTVGIAATVIGGSYTIDYQQNIDDADNYVHIDPVVDASGVLESFIFCHGGDTILTRYHTATGLSDSLHLPRPPVRSINTGIGGDSLFLYVLSKHDFLGDITHLGRVVLAGGSSEYNEIGIDAHDFGGDFIHEGNLDFVSTGASVDGVVFTGSASYIHDFMYAEWGDISMTILYPLDLASVDAESDLSAIQYMEPGTGTGPGIAGYRNTYYLWIYWHIDSIPHTEMSTDFLATDSEGNPTFTSSTEWGDSYAIFAEDFSPDHDYDEVIYYAYATDIMGLHGDKHEHIACYDFSTGSPAEIWHQPLSGVSLDYVYHPDQLIAGMRGDSMAIVLDYTTGLIVDSIHLDRHLANPLFFETSNGLSLTGRVYDTVFVYTFDTPTDISDGTGSALPENPQLHQNYPNPFNPSTRIEFELPRRAAVTVTVYNVLGQRVVRLVDKALAAGNHSIVWHGVDQDGTPVVSGVYFYRIATNDFTATKKMVLVQ